MMRIRNAGADRLGAGAGLLAAALIATFVLMNYGRDYRPSNGNAKTASQVVVPAALQVLLYGGDRFLAASFESIRAAVALDPIEAQYSDYRLRAHAVVSMLNPCHEDNYWIGNASLSFGGAPDLGLDLLGRAAQCRFWDPMPPYFFGFNQKFFRGNIAGARRAIELAADRSGDNGFYFRHIAIMFAVNSIADVREALQMLKGERAASRDSRLSDLLDARIKRLQGLLVLRQARDDFESKYGRKLARHAELINAGLIDAIPSDPTGLGYELRDGEFHLRGLRMSSLN